MHDPTSASAHQRRAELLLQQGRHDLAERELRGALAQDPHNAHAHALLAACLLDSKKLNEALKEADLTVGIAPDQGFPHYIKARAHERLDQPGEAMRSAREALAIDPENPDFHTLIGLLLHDRYDWKGALEAAELALAADPEHVEANNLRAIALTKLGRKQEAGATIKEALRRNPENSLTHANMGWKLLHEGRAKEAALSFRESLRLEPGNEWARNGLVTALKARNPIYGLFLRYALFMGRLNPRVQFGLMLGMYFLPRLIRAVTSQSPVLKPYGQGLLIAYSVFVVTTWLADPLFNLLLRVHPLGRHALNGREKWQGTILGVFALLALGVVGLWWVQRKEDLLFAALALMFSAMPVTSAVMREKAGAILMWCFGGVAAALALLGTALAIAEHKVAATACLGAIICVAVSTWVSAGASLSRKFR